MLVTVISKNIFFFNYGAELQINKATIVRSLDRCQVCITGSIILKNKKNLCVGGFSYFLYTIQIGSNCYMDTGVRDLEVACF